MIGDDYLKYGPWICLPVALFILFILWYCFADTHVDPNINNKNNKSNEITNYTDHNSESGEQGQECIYDNVTIVNTDTQRSNLTHTFGNSFMMDGSVDYNDFSPYYDDNVTMVEDITEDDVHDDPYRNIAPTKKFMETKNGYISTGERICREVLTKIYGVEFKSHWPEWLINPETGAGLELDVFNPKIGIAAEYNGDQHYHWPNYTNQSYEEFINQVRRDQVKRELCDKNGVYLITVPFDVPFGDIEKWIIDRLPETIKNVNFTSFS